jgi:hypothetical protein
VVLWFELLVLVSVGFVHLVTSSARLMCGGLGLV